MIAAHEWLAVEVARWWPRLADHLWQATLFTLVVLATRINPSSAVFIRRKIITIARYAHHQGTLARA